MKKFTHFLVLYVILMGFLFFFAFSTNMHTHNHVILCFKHYITYNEWFESACKKYFKKSVHSVPFISLNELVFATVFCRKYPSKEMLLVHCNLSTRVMKPRTALSYMKWMMNDAQYVTMIFDKHMINLKAARGHFRSILSIKQSKIVVSYWVVQHHSLIYSFSIIRVGKDLIFRVMFSISSGETSIE